MKASESKLHHEVVQGKMDSMLTHALFEVDAGNEMDCWSIAVSGISSLI